MTRRLLAFALFAALAVVPAFAQRCPAGYTLTGGRCVKNPVGGIAPGALAPTTFLANAPLTGTTFVPIRGYGIPAGDTDLYTAPAGKRVIINVGGAYNHAAVSITAFAELKSGGVYYRVSGPSAVLVAGTSSAAPTPNIILEPGESISVNTDAAGLNVSFAGIQYDASSPLRSIKTLGPASGSTLLYTAPAGKNAYLVSNSLGGLGNNANTLNVGSGAVSSGTVLLCVLPAGTTPVSCPANGAFEILTGPALTTGRTSLQFGTVSLNAGDMLVVNIQTGDPAQIVWTHVIEY